MGAEFTVGTLEEMCDLMCDNAVPEKLCDTCIYRNNVEQLKPCIIYRDNCEYYEKERGDMTDDLISRQALLDDLGMSDKTRKWGGDHSGYNTMMLYEIQDVIESQASVNPQEPKTGHWIYICNSEVNGLKIVECSECGKRTYGSGNYCPNCGARMESEDEE